MGQVNSVTLGAAAALLLLGVYAVLFRGPRSQLGRMPGPGRRHFFFGNMREVWADPDARERWVKAYGPVINVANIFNRSELLLTDLRAIAHVLNHSEVYHKPAAAKALLASILGRGVLIAEDAQHRAQRKALNPAFGPGQLRDLTGVFLDKANELRDVLLARVPSGDGVTMNIIRPLSNCTLDIIGLAGFGYDFHALSLTQPPDELALAFKDLFEAPVRRWELVIEFVFPAIRYLPTRRFNATRRAMKIMSRYGMRLIDERKAAAQAEAAQGEKLVDSARSRDLLSLLVRANTAADSRHRLSDEEVLGQIPTFLLAGHETTSTLLTWTLYRLSLHPDVQAALRAECRANPLPAEAKGNDPLDADALAALDRLPLLDAVLRETLRLDAPVPNAMRTAVGADALPLAAPLTDKRGVVHASVPIVPGDGVAIPIRLVNTSEALWGPDAKTWNPRRWTDGGLPEGVKAVPSLFAHTLSFLAGSHACIGYKFSLYEAKTILHALVGTFAFALGAPESEIGTREGLVARPMLKSSKELAQLPLVVRRVGDE